MACTRSAEGEPQPTAQLWCGPAYDAWFESPWGRYASAVEATAVVSALGRLPGRRVVDVGCGTGRLLSVLAEGGASAVGCDAEPSMLTVAKGRADVPLVQCDAASLPFPPGSFDAAVAVALLEFVADPPAVMAELCRVVRPGGRVVVGALNPRSPWGLVRPRRLRRPPWSAARFQDRGGLRSLAGSCGPATVRGTLFATPGLAAMAWAAPLVAATEWLGALVPRAGAFQVLVIERGGSGR